MSVLGSVLFGVALVGGVLIVVLYLRIITKHREYWRHLGKPLLVQWIFSSHYTGAGDLLTIKLSQVVKALAVVFFAGTAIEIIWYFAVHA